MRSEGKMFRNNIGQINDVSIRKIKYSLCMFLFCVVIFFAGNTAEATTVGENTVSKESATDVNETTGKIITEKGKKYYEYANGKRAKNEFVEVEGKTYYFGKKGTMEKGWLKKAGKYYYFDRESGVQKKNCTVDGIKIKKNGEAKKTTYSKSKIETMIKAKSIVNKVTKSTDTKKQKLKKVFDWVLKHPYKRYRILAKAQKKKGWEMKYANDIYKKGKGCCVSEASAFAFLAHECGYKKVYICDDTGHAWVEINGRVYDTLFAEVKSYKNYYNSSYKTAKLHRVGKLKI